MKRLFVLSIGVLLSTPVSVSAVVISLDPKIGAYGPGETFVTVVRIDPSSQDECINAVDLLLSYPKDLVKVSAISKGESILSLWAQEPSNSSEDGTISLVGGVPGGYCGRVMGDPGKTNIVAKIVWSIPGTQIGGTVISGTTSVPVSFAPTSYVLLNDGSGTRANVEFVSAEFQRIPEARNLANEWLGMIADDVYPPDDFTAQVVQDAGIFDGKYALVWSTVDKQSGVSHYEVLEEDPNVLGKTRGKKVQANWVRATSPYLLTDQELLSKITVRAFDQAGNRKEFVIDRSLGGSDQVAVSTSSSGDTSAAVVGVFLALLILMVFILRRQREKRRAKTEELSREYRDDSLSP